MGSVPEYVFLLTIWHLAFFWRFYKNPYLLSTSETLSTFFPYWRWLGGQLLKGRFPLKDDIYYRYPSCIPFLSNFYPVSLVCSLSRNFKVYAFLTLLHYLLASILAFLALSNYASDTVALIAAVTLVYNGYNIKLQTPCFAYTSCWIMGILLPGWAGAFCFGMAILGGYWPILIPALPILAFNPTSALGAVIALPQIVAFLWYWPRSERAKTAPSKEWGRMPWWRYFVDTCFPVSGVHYPEMSFGIGICIALLYNLSVWWILLIIGLIGASGTFVIARIPARFLYLVSFSAVMISIPALESLISHDLAMPLMFLQAVLLWRWRYQYPHFPFSQWWRKPEHYFSERRDSRDWPYFSGYMFGVRQTEYRGGFCLAE